MTEQERKQHIARLKVVLESDLHSLELLIAGTPTSPERNRYYDAQIHIREALELLK